MFPTSDGIIKEYVNLRRAIKGQIREDVPIFFRGLFIKRLISMLAFYLLMFYVKPDLVNSKLIGDLTTMNVMLLGIVIELVLNSFDIIWNILMRTVDRLFSILDLITRFPPIDMTINNVQFEKNERSD
jgi:hypothetical protein